MKSQRRRAPKISDFQYRSFTSAVAVTPYVHALMYPTAAQFQADHPHGYRPGMWWQGPKMNIFHPTALWRNSDWAGYAGGILATWPGHRRIMLPVTDSAVARAIEQHEKDLDNWMRGRLVVFYDEAEAVWYVRLAYKTTTKLPPAAPNLRSARKLYGSEYIKTPKRPKLA